MTKGLTSTERAARLRERRAAQGLVPCTIWLPAAATAEFNQAAELIRAHPELRLARLMSTKTGRMCGLKGPPREGD